MKVSVLITFYNQEKYVDEALKSVFEQECDFDYEVLIGDDGSSDGTLDKVEEWRQKYPGRISIYQMPREAGVKYNGSMRASHNRLNLLKYVKGEYFLFLDGDDFFTDVKKLQKQVEILDNPDNADCVACGHNVYRFEEATGISTPLLKLKREQKYAAKDYWGHLYFHPDSIMMRSELIEKIPVDIVRDYFNDNTITFCMIKYGAIYYLPDIMASYRQTGDGIWTGNSPYIGILRNVMDVDLERKIAPELYRSSMIRHRADIQYMVNTKGKQDVSKAAFYVDMIKRDALTSAYDWYRYNAGDIKMDSQMRKELNYARINYVLYHILWILNGR